MERKGRKRKSRKKEVEGLKNRREEKSSCGTKENGKRKM